MLVLAVMLLNLGLGGTPNGKAWAKSDLDQVQWLTYTDSRYGYSLEYPANWTVIPRDDREGTYGGVLTFIPQLPATDSATAVQIVIGVYTLERNKDQSLPEWTDLYQHLSNGPMSSEIKIEKTESIRLTTADNEEALTIAGVSPLTRFQFTNIPRGRTVWFIWTNGDATVADIYAHMLASFKFSPKTPSTLAETFGPVFQPKPRPQSIEKNNDVVSPAAVIGLPGGNWYVPTPGGNTNYTVNCGSEYHKDASAYAADISMVVNTSVYSTRRSWVDFAGWNPGYGNLMRTSTDWLYPRVYLAYYAHLNSFVLSPGVEASTLRLIAYSGNTGSNTTGPHLHFHIESLGDAVNLANLITFDENSNYPSGNAACGKMYRP